MGKSQSVLHSTQASRNSLREIDAARTRSPQPISRDNAVLARSWRSWLASLFLGLIGVPAASCFAQSTQAEVRPGEAQEIALVQAAAKKAGLDPFSHSRRDHFIGLGDADDRFRNEALKICESLATDFLKHFRDKGFKLALPAHRLTVITLKDDISYQAYAGTEDPGVLVGGHYDLETNRLVMFDFRPKGQERAVVADPERVNLLALVHETTHLLCYNTGLLSREANVPDWVNEGLATYVELWRRKQTPIGGPNRPWLSCLRDAKNTNTPWIAIPKLLASDESFDDKKTAQLSYAESWLLVHYLMKEPQLPKFRAYLGSLPAEGTASERVEHVEKHLGPKETLDRELGRELSRELKRAGR